MLTFPLTSNQKKKKKTLFKFTFLVLTWLDGESTSDQRNINVIVLCERAGTDLGRFKFDNPSTSD